MNAKRFSLGIIGFFTTLALAVWLLIWLMPEERYMDGDYSHWIQQRDHVLEDSSQPEILLLGDSTLMIDVKANLFHKDAYNLAIGGATPIEMYYTLVDYLNHHPKPKMVIVAFAPRHYFHLDCYISRDVYFHYMSPERIWAANNVLREQDHTDYRLESLEYMLHSPRIYMKRVLKAVAQPRTDVNQDIYSAKVNERGGFTIPGMQMKNVEDPITQMGPFRPRKSLTDYMDKIIELCLEENIEIHIEQMPMGLYGWKKLEANGLLKDYAGYMQSFADRYHIDVNPVVPGYEDEYFGDIAHLNSKGAEKFTEELRQKYFKEESVFRCEGE